MDTLRQDLRYAIRGFRKSLGFTLAAVFALALGIGANTAIFSAVNAVLLNSRALNSLNAPDRLVMVWEKNPRLSTFIADRMQPRLNNYLDWKKESRAFEGLAIFDNTRLNLTAANDSAGRKPEQVSAAEASADFLPLLGIRPRLGRNFKPEEMQVANGKVAIISDELYRSRFNSDPQILGKVLPANGVEYQIIGVLPRDFELPAMWEGLDQSRPKVWIPVEIAPGLREQRSRSFFVFGRLKTGVTLAQAHAEMNVIAKRLERADPESDRGFGVNVFPLSVEDIDPTLRKSLFVLQIAVGFVLLIACANVANLLLTRAVRREKEIAVRLALGAARGRIVRQMLSESLLLSVLGGLSGLLLAFAALRAVSVFAPPDTHGFHELRVDPLVLGFTVLVTMIAGLLFGLAPAFHALPQNVNDALGRGARGVGGTSNRLRGALVVSEVALSLILLIGAGLMIRSLTSLMSTDMGFHPDHLLTMHISLPPLKYSKPEQVAAFNRRLVDAVRQIPGVRFASLSDALPMESINETSYDVEGKPTKPEQEPVAERARVQDGYLETLGVKLYRGRTFTQRDVLLAQPKVAVVSQAFARVNWPNEDALGKAIVFPQDNGKSLRYSVIGIVGDKHELGPDSPTHPEMYLPEHDLRSMILVVRTAGDPLAMRPAIENQVWNLDKEQPVSGVHTMEHILHDWTAPRRFSMMVLLNFAVLALVLAAVGLYSVLAYSVGLRTREIGVRVALGAEPRRVASLVVGQGLKLVAVGVAVGLAGAFAVTRFLKSLVFGVTTTDPDTFAIVTVLLVAVALVASYLPARRAARIDPIQALRVE